MSVTFIPSSVTPTVALVEIQYAAKHKPTTSVTFSKLLLGWTHQSHKTAHRCAVSAWHDGKPSSTPGQCIRDFRLTEGMGQVFVYGILRFPPISINPPTLQTCFSFIYHWLYTILVFQQIWTNKTPFSLVYMLPISVYFYTVWCWQSCRNMQVSEVGICTSCLEDMAVTIVVCYRFVLAFLTLSQHHDKTTVALHWITVTQKLKRIVQHVRTRVCQGEVKRFKLLTCFL